MKSMDKKDYLKVRSKLVRQLNRKKEELNRFNKKAERKSLSGYGFERRGFLTGHIFNLENTLDVFDEYFDIPYSDDFSLTDIKKVN